MQLPVKYDTLTPKRRRAVREAYVRLQNGLCYHCGAPLDMVPAPDVSRLPVNVALFPPFFFQHPVHLHHNHRTGMTLGAVHCYCNAVLWQYYGE